MLRFNDQSPFYQENAELIRQYNHTKQLLDKRQLDPKSAESEVMISARNNLKAQAASLLSKALAKHGDNYIHLEFLYQNFAVFDGMFKKEKKQSKDDLHLLKQIELLKSYYTENQKSIFQIAYTRSLTKEDILACGPYLNLLYASCHEEEKQLFKYDSLLHYVVRLGDVGSVQILLEAGFDVNGYKPDYSYKDKKMLLLIPHH